MKMIWAFFNGKEIPKPFTHIVLILVPKIDHPNTFADLGLIIPVNVSYKIISKVTNGRLSIILPNIISCNQSGFIKGRSISENVILVQGS